jgi:hypothetical protein
MAKKVWPIGRFEDLHYHPEKKTILNVLSKGSKATKASIIPLKENLVEAADYSRKLMDWDQIFEDRKEELECSKNPSWKGKLFV